MLLLFWGLDDFGVIKQDIILVPTKRGYYSFKGLNNLCLVSRIVMQLQLEPYHAQEDMLAGNNIYPSGLPLGMAYLQAFVPGESNPIQSNDIKAHPSCITGAY